ncbi:MAG: hypothetical protein P8X79_17875 [Reinekea sp.]
MLPKNWGEPMGAPAIFEKQIEIKHTRADGALFMQKGLPSMAIPRLCDRG